MIKRISEFEYEGMANSSATYERSVKYFLFGIKVYESIKMPYSPNKNK